MNTIARKGGLWIAAGTVVGVAAGIVAGLLARR